MSEPMEVWRETVACTNSRCIFGRYMSIPGGLVTCEVCNGSGYVPGDLALVVHWYDDCGPSLCVVLNGVAVGFLQVNDLAPGSGAYNAIPLSGADTGGVRVCHDNPETAANMLLVGLGLRRAV